MEHYRKLERMYLTAPINQRDKPVLKVEDGLAEIRQGVGPHLHHGAGAMHGSIYFKMLDDACFFAANSKITETLVLTAHFEIDLLKPVVSGQIVAKAEATEITDRRVHAKGELLGPDGAVIARGNGVFVISRIALTPELGYL